MKRLMASTVAVTFAGVCCAISVYFSALYYHRHKNDSTLVQSYIPAFDMRLGRLEAHKARELRPERYWGIISTSDRPEDKGLQFYRSSAQHPADYYEGIGAKGGSVIRPELRLSAGAAADQEFTIQFPSGREVVLADAWLSHAAPFTDLAAFEEFRAFVPYRTNVVTIIARPKPGASVHMRFEIVVLFVE